MFSGCKRNCESLQSYISTKLVRFLLYLGVTKYSISQETWRYVKCPKDLEHIYTDRELYDYYHLTLDEIRIIEDTILDMSDIRHRSELSYDKILERTFKILDTWCEDVENLVFVLEELVLRITEYKEENNSDIDRTIAYHSLVDVMRRINNLNPLRKVEKYSEKLHGKHNSSLDVTTREILELLRTYESERVLNGDVTLITEEDVDTLIHEAKCVIELYYKILFRDI